MDLVYFRCIAYTFGIYSSALKSSQGYNQSTLDTISVFKDIGANAGILSGVLYDIVTTQRWRSSSLGRPPSPASFPDLQSSLCVCSCSLGPMVKHSSTPPMSSLEPAMFLAIVAPSSV
ncbi:hypothetical protein G4B88_008494 [Cannabis sativa]|uniref:Nodulin-like domain-containing protein n=1 Tax=Cannabis sativa TaxID=3483 RepID=A0A7J6DVH4_CANSA|nr:hypothetical protein G4B88_008494 [Cannabis sativa]